MADPVGRDDDMRALPHGRSAPRPGDRLDDRFELEQQIGSGGMGEVFRAHDLRSGEPVAVKVIADERSHRTARFAREIKVLAELSHPGIVRYITHGVTPSGALFLVMEWLDGDVLDARLRRGPLTAHEAVTLATRVAEALGAAHAHGIIHRDLKPSNLLLPGGHIEQVKLLDFGIAQREGRTQLTRTGTVVGTPGYMAPEQARIGGPIDVRADVFSLGCVMFECLTGVAPFDGDNIAAILAKILFGAAPRVSELWPEVPEPLGALVGQMLSKDPALRPSNGTTLAAALAALGPVARDAAPAPRDRVVKLPVFLGGERRLLAVVMLGSAAQDDGPTEQELGRAVLPYGGTLTQLADGSTIVVLEAERQVATDRAGQAARCALALRALATDRPMAIAMGRADSTSKLPGVDVIDRASRLLAAPARPPGDLPAIVLDEVTAGLLDARFEVIEREARLVLCGARALARGARTLLGRPTSCVGRDWELGVLTGILDACIDEGEARVALVTAAAGMGKSRLGAELVRRAQDRHPAVAIWSGRGDSLRAGSTLDLLAQALRGTLGISEGEPLPLRRDKIRARVAEHVGPGDQRRVAEFLAELVGAPSPGGDDGSAQLKAARQDAQLMSEQMRKAWLDFLQAEATAHPILLVLEDLHWGDFGTVRFIDTALRDCRKHPWMVLALARPEVFEVFPRLWADRQHVQEIRLKDLGRKAGERLVRQVLGDHVGTETVEHLVRQAGGNAFYLEELIRAVAEGKDKATPLPGTVLAMVETRLGRLPFEARRVLRAASVFGEVCWEGGVVTLLGGAMAAAMVSEWLGKLVELEVLAARPKGRFPGERELAFRHALLREGAHATLTAEDERLAHRLAGQWLEQHGEADPMVLAGHFQRGGDGARTAGCYLRAGRQALHVADLEAVIVRADLGLGCDPPPELRIVLLGLRCEASQALQRVTMPEAEELLRSAPRGGIPWAQGMLAYHLGTLMTGRIDDFLASLAVLGEVTPAPGAAGAISLLFLTGIFVLDNFGRVPQGTALEEPFLALVRARGDQEPLARVWWNIAAGMRASYAHDDPWAGLQHSDAIQPLFDEIGGDNLRLNMQLLRGANQWYLGALARGAQALEGIPAADTTLGMASSLRRFFLSWLYADRGALDEARALATQLGESGRAHHNPLEEGRGRWVLAEVLRRMGDLDGAERELGVALAVAGALEHPGVLGTLSALRLAQGRARDALAAAEDALTREAAMGGCGMFRGAFVRLAHAEALHATGAHDAARRAIADARTRLFAIAGKIADPDHQASFLAHVPENARTLALASAWLG
jgi:tetratricopeptide (TPR) repeat protein